MLISSYQQVYSCTNDIRGEVETLVHSAWGPPGWGLESWEEEEDAQVEAAISALLDNLE